MSQLHAQYRALQTLHAVIESTQHMVILAILSPVAQHANSFRISSVVRRDRSALPIRSEVFGGIETETSDVADAARSPAFVLRPVRFCGIFNHNQAMAPRDLQDRVHVGCLSVEMDRQNHFRSRSNRRLDRSRIHVERSRL